MTSLAIIEMDSTVRGLQLSAEARMGGDIELEMLDCENPSYFVAVFRGKRDELLTVLDTVFDTNGHGYLKRTVLPSPEEGVLDVISSGGKMVDMDRIEGLGVVETSGFGVMARCVDLSLKEPAVQVTRASFDKHSGKGLVYLTGEDSLLRSLIKEMKGICGTLNITDTAVINSPPKEITSALAGTDGKETSILDQKLSIKIGENHGQ